MEMKSKDLWQSAYMLAEGGTLAEIELDCRRGRKEVIFIFRGEELGKLARSFESGQAYCKVSQLRACMEHLKDVMFSRLRDY